MRSWWIRFAVIALLYGALLYAHPHAIWWTIGLAAVASTGIGMIRLSGRERRDLRLLDREGEPRDGERVAICGVVEADGVPFDTPVRRRGAVLYHYQILHDERWSAAVGGGPKPVVDFAGYGAAPCSIGGTKLGKFPVLHDFDALNIHKGDTPAYVREHVGRALFEPLGKGEIEWVQIGDDLWDGGEPVARNFRRPGAELSDRAYFHETAVSPGDRACAIGDLRGGILGGELHLHRGTKETVRERLSSSAGCSRIGGFLLIAASLAAAIYISKVATTGA